MKIWQRLADNQIGYLSHKGLKLLTSTNYETTLSINNGENPPGLVLENDKFKESFLVAIDSDYYFIADIDGTTITLGGPDNYWKTLGAGGTSVSFTIYHYTKNSFESDDGTSVSFIDRRGKDIITNSLDVGEVVNAMAMYLNAKDSQFIDAVSQNESIAFEIKWADGKTQQGEV